jgi:outer membrane protein assembly factor BamB
MRGTATRLLVVILSISALAADWPNWMGPNRNGSSPETGLLTDWPTGGPKVLWKVNGGDGYSSVAVAAGRAYTLVQRGKEELVIALEAAKGKELWATPIAPAYMNQYGNGPRATPAIEGKHVWANSVTGPVVCLEADTGKIVWQKNLLKDFGAENISWGLSASPVLDGERLYVIPGAKGAGVAALSKKTGEVLWKTGDDKAGYASPVAATVGGKRQVIFFTAAGLLAVQAEDGKELWRVPWKTEYDVNICTPLLHGDLLFVASGENVGSTLFRLRPEGKPEIVWESKGTRGIMTTYWANAVIHDGHLYGVSGEFAGVINFNCVDLKTGKLVWSQERFGKASITLADGHLFVTTKPGDLVLIRATPKAYEEKARIKGLIGENRTVPTIADGRMYLRDRKQIVCLDISGKK